MPRYGMVIDLQRCVGCGACALACKTENNTSDRANGQTFNWADFIVKTEGAFPDVRTSTLPVLCNHCANAPCVEECPVTPKAMYKTPEGITMHNDERCIGCQLCQEACPYSVLDINEEREAQYSVISFNETAKDLHARYKDAEELIDGCTSSGAEITRRAEQLPPHRTLYKHPDYGSVRRPGVTEKCTFCAHRLAEGRLPACVEACPAEARIFGDLSDPESAPSKALRQHGSFRLKEEAGTEPAVHYIRSYQAAKKAASA